MQVDDIGSPSQDRSAAEDTFNSNLAILLQERVESVIECLNELRIRGRQPLSSDKGLAFIFDDKPPELEEQFFNGLITAQLGTTGPRLVGPNQEADRQSGFSIVWAPDTIMAIQAGKVAKSDVGVYRTIINGQLVEWEAAENKVLRHFCWIPFRIKDDIEKDEKTRQHLLAWLEKTISPICFSE